ncbi:MAG: hypothetical protein AB7O98_09375 [Hyphomonadaceae bacterium]
MSAFAFNLCLLLLPLAGAAALVVIARDQLYAYEYSDTGARAVAERVADLNGSLIQIDFDRQRQWDDLVAMELAAGDYGAARGFLLSAQGMLPPRAVGALEAAANDAELERAALVMLTPTTRERYEANVPLLSNRADTSAQPAVELGDQADFELMAGALLADPETEPLQFVLTGFSLGLAGDFDRRRSLGAAALLAATRRDDYPVGFGAEITNLFSEAMPIAAFRTAARDGVASGDAARFENAAAAFAASVNSERAARVREVLDAIGDMADATSVNAAASMISHAATIHDLPRLRLLALAAGDRMAAAAKRLPRDGSLLAAAHGELKMTRDLMLALAVAGLALAGLVLIALWNLAQALLAWLNRWRDQDDDYGAELLDLGGSNFRPL